MRRQRGSDPGAQLAIAETAHEGSEFMPDTGLCPLSYSRDMEISLRPPSSHRRQFRPARGRKREKVPAMDHMERHQDHDPQAFHWGEASFRAGHVEDGYFPSGPDSRRTGQVNRLASGSIA